MNNCILIEVDYFRNCFAVKGGFLIPQKPPSPYALAFLQGGAYPPDEALIMIIDKRYPGGKCQNYEGSEACLRGYISWRYFLFFAAHEATCKANCTQNVV